MPRNLDCIKLVWELSRSGWNTLQSTRAGGGTQASLCKNAFWALHRMKLQTRSLARNREEDAKFASNTLTLTSMAYHISVAYCSVLLQMINKFSNNTRQSRTKRKYQGIEMTTWTGKIKLRMQWMIVNTNYINYFVVISYCFWVFDIPRLCPGWARGLV